eukprot:m.29318 g.29318  ORF g.29318 m.29318 type:complete len:698 (+) comp6140_c0_seq1:113-2206(+)
MTEMSFRMNHQYGESSTDEFEPRRSRTSSDARSIHSMHSVHSHTSSTSFPHSSHSSPFQQPTFQGSSFHHHHQQQHVHHQQQQYQQQQQMQHLSSNLTSPQQFDSVSSSSSHPRSHCRTASDTSALSLSVSIHSFTSESTHEAYLYVSPPPKNLICAICGRVFHSPVIANCGHTFCNACVQKSPANQVCPIHMTVLGKAHKIPNLSVAEQIQALEVHCPNGVMKMNDRVVEDPNGCPEIVTMSNLSQHRAVCAFTKITCPNSNRCGPVLRREMQMHLDQCQHHKCENNLFGCKFTGSRADVQHHKSSCSLAHRQISAPISNGSVSSESFAQLQYQLKHKDQEVAALNNTIAKLSTRVSSLEAEAEDRNAIMERLQLTLSNLQRTVEDNAREISVLNAYLGSIEASDTGGLVRTSLYKCVGTFVGHQGNVWSLATHNDLLFSASTDESIKVWDTATDFKCKRTLTEHRDKVLCLTVAGRRLYSGSEDKTIKVWDVDKLTLIDTLTSHDSPVCALVVVNNTLYSGSNRCIIMWDTQTLKNIGSLKGFNHWVRALVVADSLLFAGSYQTVSVWRASSEETERLHVLQTSGGSVFSLCVSDHFIIAGTYESPIHIWDRESYEPVKILEGHTRAIHGLAVLPDRGKGRLFSASYDKTVRVWNLETFQPLQVLERHQQSVLCVVVLKGKIFTGAADHTVKVWQ